jgi:hypothetical protein
VPYYPPQEHPLLAAPGYTYVTFTFQYEGEDFPRSPVGDPGEYEATFTLQPPGQVAEKITDEHASQIVEVADENLLGDSHLVLYSPDTVRASSDPDARCVVNVGVNRLESGTGITEIRLEPNDSGRASKIFVRTSAENFDDAEQRAYFETSSLLSDFAFKLDIPLRIVHTHIKEMATKHTRTGYVRQFSYRSLANLPEFNASTGGSETLIKAGAYPALASIYREALNSDSAFYQILCFCRIIQRLVEKLRPQWKSTFREHDIALPLYLKEERMPTKGDSATRIPEGLRGMKFTKVYQDHLRPLRNSIGHVFLEDEDDQDSAERSTDEFDFVSNAYTHLPVAHHIARAMLENDFGPAGLARFASELQARNAKQGEAQGQT